jgi:SulP family sulfate permease
MEKQTGGSRRLPRYGWALLRRDLVAGLTVASVAVPQAVACALLAGVPPEHGLYAAIVITALGALFGSSAHLINGPTNAVSLAVLAVVAGAGTGMDDRSRAGLAALLAVLVGLVQITLSLLKLGRLARHVPEAVIRGFMAGAGLLVALSQVPTLLGLPSAGTGEDSILYRLWLAFWQGDRPDFGPLGIGLSIVVLVVGLHRLNARFEVKVPEVLLGLVLVSSLVGLLGLAPAGGRIGRLHVASGFPTPGLPRLPPNWEQQLRPIGGGALAIALLGLVEALAMARSLSARSGQPLDSNRQCLAEGLANLGGGLCGAMPGSGSLSLSTINHAAGAATRWSGVVSAAAVAATLWLAAPLARFVPQPALAGILLCAAWRILDPPQFWACLRSSRSDAAIALATAFTAVFIRVELAVPVGIAAAVLRPAASLLRRASREARTFTRLLAAGRSR